VTGERQPVLNVFLCLSPGKMGSSFKCFGAAPLENIVKNRKNIIMEDLENALAQQAPAIQHINPDLHELPPLVCCIVMKKPKLF